MKRVLFLLLAVAVGFLGSGCGGDDTCGYGEYCWVCPTHQAFETCCDPFPLSPDLCGQCVRVDVSYCWK